MVNVSLSGSRTIQKIDRSLGIFAKEFLEFNLIFETYEYVCMCVGVYSIQRDQKIVSDPPKGRKRTDLGAWN